MITRSKLLTVLICTLLSTTCFLSCRKQDQQVISDSTNVPPPASPKAQKQMVTTVTFDNCGKKGCPHHIVKFKNQRALLSWFDDSSGGWVTVDPDGFDSINLCGYPDPHNSTGCDPTIIILDSVSTVTVTVPPPPPPGKPGWAVKLWAGGPAPLTPFLDATHLSSAATSGNSLVPFGPSGQPMTTITLVNTTTSGTTTTYTFQCSYGPPGGGPSSGTIMITVTVN